MLKPDKKNWKCTKALKENYHFFLSIFLKKMAYYKFNKIKNNLLVLE